MGKPGMDPCRVFPDQPLVCSGYPFLQILAGHDRVLFQFFQDTPVVISTAVFFVPWLSEIITRLIPAAHVNAMVPHILCNRALTHAKRMGDHPFGQIRLRQVLMKLFPVQESPVCYTGVRQIVFKILGRVAPAVTQSAARAFEPCP